MPPVVLRPAREDDIPALEKLIALSVHSLQSDYYSLAQREAALGPVFAVDRQMVRDGTYFVVEADEKLAGCGGWSQRSALFGAGEGDTVTLLKPAMDAARIRAFFVHPDCARQGIGSRLLSACEEELRAAGFHRAELVATLAGEPFYQSRRYTATERFEIALAAGQSLPVVLMTKLWTA